MAKAYTSPGNFRTGVWLVKLPGGGAGLYPPGQLPSPDGRTQFYWLGTTANQISDRIPDAFGKLGLHPFSVDNSWNQDAAIRQALGGNPAQVPAGGGNASIPLLPGAGGLGPGPGGLTKTVSQVSSPFSGVANTLASVADMMKWIAWLFHPRNLLRAVEFVTGVALIGFGLWAAVQARGERQEGFSTSEGALGRSGLGRVARELGRAASGPEGRAAMGKPRRAPHRTQRLARERGREAATRPARHRRP